MSILVIAEIDQASSNDLQLKVASLSAITAAKKIADIKNSAVELLVIGSALDQLAQSLIKISGVQKVLIADDKNYQHALAENYAPVVSSIAKKYSHVIVAATSFGKNLLPRVAADLDVDMVSEVIQILDANTYVRPLYAGSLNSTVKNTESIQLLSIRATAFGAATIDAQNVATIEKIPAQAISDQSGFIELKIQKSDRPELSTAKVVVTGGRSLGSAEKFNEVILPLAEKLNAATGATRAAVDAGFAPNEWQVGQTGTVVAPDLYFAFGVSGAAQHLAGMKESKVIVAVNHDPDAPIFQVADYGLVADLFDVAKELSEKL